MHMEIYNYIVQTEKFNHNTDSLTYIHLQALLQLRALEFKPLSVKRDMLQSNPH